MKRRFHDDTELDALLRTRPLSGPEPSEEDRYHDAETRTNDAEDLPPWLDFSDDREAEL